MTELTNQVGNNEDEKELHNSDEDTVINTSEDINQNES